MNACGLLAAARKSSTDWNRSARREFIAVATMRIISSLTPQLSSSSKGNPSFMISAAGGGVSPVSILKRVAPKA